MRIVQDPRIAGVDEEKVALQSARLEAVLRTLYVRAGNVESAEAFMNEDFAKNECTRAETWWKMFGHGMTHALVIGIGGSTNASKAVYEALPVSQNMGKLYFLETVDEKIYNELEQMMTACPPEELAVLVISKSGNTIEVLANLERVRAMIRRIHSQEARVGVITLADTALARMAQKMQWPHLLSHGAIPDRFAAFTVTTLVPLCAVGVQIREFVLGIGDAIRKNEESMHTAVIRALRYHAGDRVQDLFFFHPELEALGKWQRALLAESLGKAETRDKKPVHISLEPVVSIGTQDLHAVLQLRFGSGGGTLTSFVVTEELLREEGGVQAALFQSIQATYQERKLPFYTIALDGMIERELGAFMAYAMSEAVLLADLFEVNPFDQPEVEGYKERAREAIAAQEHRA